MKVWITYSYEDKEFVKTLKNVLTNENIEVLDIENQIKPGDNIIETIYKSISEAEVIFVILSNSNSGRQWFSTEIGLIVSEIKNHRHKKIIPILKDKDADIPFFISQYQFLDATNAKSLKEQIETLLPTLISKESEFNITINNSSSNDIFISRDVLLEKEKIEYEKSRIKKQKYIYIVFLTTILTTLISILSIILTTNKFLNFNIYGYAKPVLLVGVGMLLGGVISAFSQIIKK